MPYAIHCTPVLAGEDPNWVPLPPDPRVRPFNENLYRLGVFNNVTGAPQKLVRIGYGSTKGAVLPDGSGLHGWFVWRADWDE